MILRKHSWRGQNLQYIVELMVWNWKWRVIWTFSWWKCEELGNFMRNSIDFWIYRNWIWVVRNWVGMWPGSLVIVQELNGCISVGTWTEWFHSGISIPKPWYAPHFVHHPGDATLTQEVCLHKWLHCCLSSESARALHLLLLHYHHHQNSTDPLNNFVYAIISFMHLNISYIVFS